MMEYSSDESQSIEVRDYRPVFINDDDSNSSEELQTPQQYNHINKCYSCIIKTIKICKYILLLLDILYLICLIALLHQGLLDYVRETLSGYTSQPILEEYVKHCDLTWNNIKNRFNIWLVIHFGENMLFTLAVRNRTFMWINSIILECIQYTYYTTPIFNISAYKECWYEVVIFLIFNALGIEVGLLILKYILNKICPLYPEWTIAFKMVCADFKCQLKWIIIIFNLLFLLSMIQIFCFGLYDYTLWVGPTSYLSAIRFSLLIISSIGVFSQSYKCMFRDISCFSRSSIKNIYWIIILWLVILLEFLLTLRHYLS